MVSYFLNNAAKTSYWLKISENIKIEHVFQSKAFFHLTTYLHTSCFSVFKGKKPTAIIAIYVVFARLSVMFPMHTDRNIIYILAFKSFVKYWLKFIVILLKDTSQ